MTNIEFLLASFLNQKDFNLISSQIKNINAENTLFNGEIKVNREEEHLRVHINQNLENFANTEITKLNSNLTLAKDINLNNLNLSFDEEQLNLSGEIKDWQNKHKLVNLKLSFEDTDLNKPINQKLLFLKSTTSDSFLRKLFVLSDKKYSQGIFNLKLMKLLI